MEVIEEFRKSGTKNKKKHNNNPSSREALALLSASKKHCLQHVLRDSLLGLGSNYRCIFLARALEKTQWIFTLAMPCFKCFFSAS